MITPDPNLLSSAEKDSTVSTFQSILSGIGSGLISIPKGAFSLGATLYDLGAGTNKAVSYTHLTLPTKRIV